MLEVGYWSSIGVLSATPRAGYLSGMRALALCLALVSFPALADPPTPSAPRTAVGRFQVVNGTPDRSGNIMLLDTVTGETWIICDYDGESRWCPMTRSTAPAKSARR